MPGCAAVGVFAKCLVMPKASPSDATPTFNASSERYLLLYESLSANKQLTGTRVITGSLSVYGNNLVPQPYTPAGQIGLQPGPSDIDLWMPRILGGGAKGANVANFIDVGESLPVFDMLMFRDNGTFHYKNCRVARAIFRGQAGPTQDEGEILNMNLSIIAEDEDEVVSWPGSIPAVPTGGNRAPYYFTQGTLTVASTIYPLDQFTLMIDNNLQVRHRNSLSPTCVFSAGRTVRLETNNPFTTANWALADTLYTTGSNASLKFSNGLIAPNLKSCDFQFPLVRAFKQSPSARGRGEIPLSLKMQSFRTVSSGEIKVESIYT